MYGTDDVVTYQNYCAQKLIIQAEVSGITSSADVTNNLINQGNITIESVPRVYSFGISSAVSSFTNIVNKGDISVSDTFAFEVAGITRYPKNLNHILNSGNIEVKGKTHSNGYIGGIGARQSSSDYMNIDNTFNTGNIDISELESVSGAVTTAHTLTVGGIIGSIPAKVHNAVIENSANYGDLICESVNPKDWRTNLYLGGIAGYWIENSPGTTAANTKKISNCINDGNIRMNVVGSGYVGAHNVGGIVRLYL